MYNKYFINANRHTYTYTYVLYFIEIFDRIKNMISEDPSHSSRIVARARVRYETRAYTRVYQQQRGEDAARSSPVILGRVLTSNMRPVQRVYIDRRRHKQSSSSISSISSLSSSLGNSTSRSRDSSLHFFSSRVLNSFLFLLRSLNISFSFLLSYTNIYLYYNSIIIGKYLI